MMEWDSYQQCVLSIKTQCGKFEWQNPWNPIHKGLL